MTATNAVISTIRATDATNATNAADATDAKAVSDSPVATPDPRSSNAPPRVVARWTAEMI